MKIVLLEISNFKRIKALRLVPTEKGLTVIGGNNAQGKTSVLDAIQFGFGGKKYMPSNWKRDGAVGDTSLRIETDNGLVIERKGKNMDLVVTDRDGKRGGQSLLDAFVSELAIDLPKFHNASPTDKADMLLDALGIGVELEKIDAEIKASYDQRTSTGKMRDEKRAHAKEMPFYEDAPNECVSVSELVKRQQDVLARNGVRQNALDRLERNRERLAELERKAMETAKDIEAVRKEIADAEGGDFAMEPTDEIERQIADFETVNAHVRANEDRRKAENDADILADRYDVLTKEIERGRERRLALLNGAKFPLEGLSVDNDAKGRPVLTYDGKPWDCMSGSQQLIVDTAIASMLNPECRFVNLDKLEQLDLDTLKDFDRWLCERDLQCIATRVSTGGECSVIIEDGEADNAGTVVETKRKPSEDEDWD